MRCEQYISSLINSMPYFSQGYAIPRDEQLVQRDIVNTDVAQLLKHHTRNIFQRAAISNTHCTYGCTFCLWCYSEANTDNDAARWQIFTAPMTLLTRVIKPKADTPGASLVSLMH